MNRVQALASACTSLICLESSGEDLIKAMNLELADLQKKYPDLWRQVEYVCQTGLRG